MCVREKKREGETIFICENNRKSNKIMHCVEKKIFDWQF